MNFSVEKISPNDELICEAVASMTHLGCMTHWKGGEKIRRTAVRETGVSWHHGDPINGPLNIMALWRGSIGALNGGPHSTERPKAPPQPM